MVYSRPGVSKLQARGKNPLLIIFIKSTTMRTTLIAIAILSLTSCVRDLERIDRKSIIPKEIQKQWEMFLDYAPSNVKARPFEVRLIDGPVLNSDGYPVSGLTKHKERLILIDTRSNAYKNARTHLILHELGHLILKREHTTSYTTIDDSHYNMPHSVMNLQPIINEFKWQYPEVEEYYMTELFD